LVVDAKAQESIDIPSDIQEMAQKRWQSKCNKNWAEADQLRDELLKLGWIVKDGKEGFELAKSD
jgi:cysteinyl-tRNA synthetase